MPGACCPGVACRLERPVTWFSSPTPRGTVPPAKWPRRSPPGSGPAVTRSTSPRRDRRLSGRRRARRPHRCRGAAPPAGARRRTHPGHPQAPGLPSGLCHEYQPTVDHRSEAVTGVEALVRWRHPARGVVAPGSFVPMPRRPADRAQRPRRAAGSVRAGCLAGVVSVIPSVKAAAGTQLVVGSWALRRCLGASRPQGRRLKGGYWSVRRMNA